MKYTREDICRAWLTRAVIPSDILIALMKQYESAENIYETFLDSDSLAFSEYLTANTLHYLKQFSSQDEMHNLAQAMSDGRMQIVAYEDPDYPEMLRNIPLPPAFLFYRGDLRCAHSGCVTIVGSRNASSAALTDTERVAGQLAAGGAVIVSGLAPGIDSAAHRGCLRAGGRTIGMMACGLDVNYPRENASLKKDIINSGGLLMSEYPPGTPPSGWRFPVRNRIMSGLSRCVLMMECRIRSGSMTTVQHALDQGREVYAYPGKPGTEWAEGAHQLLREGANYFTSADDILEDMGWKQVSQAARPMRSPAASAEREKARRPAAAKPPAVRTLPAPSQSLQPKRTFPVPIINKIDLLDMPPEPAPKRRKPRSTPVLREPVVPYDYQLMTDVQQKIYQALANGEQSFDQLAAVTGLPVSILSGELTMLQLEGYIKALPGKCYCRT